MESYVAGRRKDIDREWTRRRTAAMAETARQLGIRNALPYGAADLLRITEHIHTRNEFIESARWRADELRRLQREGSDYHAGGGGEQR